MCFRPPTVTKPIKCHECGKLNPPQNSNCINCKAELRKEKKEETN